MPIHFGLRRRGRETVFGWAGFIEGSIALSQNVNFCVDGWKIDSGTYCKLVDVYRLGFGRVKEEEGYTREGGEHKFKHHRGGWLLVDQGTDYSELVWDFIFIVKVFVLLLERLGRTRRNI